MKICVLLTDYSDTDHHLKYVDKPRDPGSFDKTNLHTYDLVPIRKQTAAKQVLELHSKGQYDVFVNLCEGSLADEVPGVEVAEMLHKLNTAYTGAGSFFYSLNKLAMKMAACSVGVSIPNHVFAYDKDDILKAAEQIDMPLIVKHHNGHDSIGMTEKSRVTTFDQLKNEAQKFILKYGGALIEEFIDGPEFTVLVVDNPADSMNPFVYEPIECQFANGDTFKHFSIKWHVTKGMQWVPVKDKGLAERLKEAAKLVFLGCSGNGYGRCDFRLKTSTHELIFLEINGNCSVFYTDPEDYGSADQIVNSSPDGHQGFLHKIINNAIFDQNKRRKCWRTSYTPKRGFLMQATEDIPFGHVIQMLEQAPSYLVSRKYANQNWAAGSLNDDWLKSYGYLISPNVYATWHLDANQWEPVNHSCDPNSWFDGLNVVARRPIKKGEEITLDYATYAAHDIQSEKSFECHCHATNCRKIIKPTSDLMLPGLMNKYGDHVTDFIKMKIEENAAKK